MNPQLTLCCKRATLVKVNKPPDEVTVVEKKSYISLYTMP